MVTVLLRFPAGRYHATPWEHHVNEGVIEWPPSPWRLLRAFISTGYTKLHWPASEPPAAARSLIGKLAGQAPFYALPSAVGAHTRHYMPTGAFKKDREDTTLVFDTWADVGDGIVGVRWDVSLDDEERLLLRSIVTNIGYLGRSESWVDADLLDADPTPVWLSFDVCPSWGNAEDVERHPSDRWEIVRLRATLAPDVYEVWRQEQVSRRLVQNSNAHGSGRRTSVRRTGSASVDCPSDVNRCLEVETPWLHRNGWNEPPGSQLIPYWRRRNALEPAELTVPRRTTAQATPTFVLLALAPASGSLGSMPPTARTLPQGELLHRALVSQAMRLGGHSPVLSGTDAEGRPLTTPHTHAHLLHLDLDADGHLDHVLVWAPMGLDQAAMTAVRAVRQTFTKGGMKPLRVAVAGYGDIRTLTGAGAVPAGLERIAPAGGSTRWKSVTPFVPPRFLKARGRNSLDGQVAAELLVRGLPEPRRVRVVQAQESDDARRLRHFVRRRRNQAPPVDAGYALDLEFGQPVVGPLALGFGSHFGLGLFKTGE